MTSTSELYQTSMLHPRLWSRIVTGHQLFGTRFSESLNTVKDVAEKSLSEDYDSLIKSTARSVKSDMAKDFSSYGHHMWDLGKN